MHVCTHTSTKTRTASRACLCMQARVLVHASAAQCGTRAGCMPAFGFFLLRLLLTGCDVAVRRAVGNSLNVRPLQTVAFCPLTPATCANSRVKPQVYVKPQCKHSAVWFELPAALLPATLLKQAHTASVVGSAAAAGTAGAAAAIAGRGVRRRRKMSWKLNFGGGCRRLAPPHRIARRIA